MKNKVTVYFWHNRGNGTRCDLPKFNKILLKSRQNICGNFL